MASINKSEKVIWEGKPSLVGSLSFIGIFGHLMTGGVSLLIKWLLLNSIDYRITNRYIHKRSGLFSKSDNEIKLYRIRDISAHQSLWQRVFGYTNIRIKYNDNAYSIISLNHPLKAVPDSLLPRLREVTSQAHEKQNIQIIE